jgi:hypothetical protein
LVSGLSQIRFTGRFIEASLCIRKEGFIFVIRSVATAISLCSGTICAVAPIPNCDSGGECAIDV